MTSCTPTIDVAVDRTSSPSTTWAPARPIGTTAQGQSQAQPATQGHIVFLDTEFTKLGPDALLLSVGMVSDTARPEEFYGEVTDPSRLAAAGWFARAAVTPQFGRLPDSGCSYHELGVRIAAFLRTVLAKRPLDASARIAFESDCDWTLIVRAVSQSCPRQWRELAARLEPTNVYNMAGFAAGERAAQAYFQSQATAVISRHHALCDARALRIAYRAAEADTRAIHRVCRPASLRPPSPLPTAGASMPDTLA